MSFRGLSKALSRLPHIILQKTGKAQETKDPEFLSIIQTFNKSLSTIEKLIADILKYNDSLHNFLKHQRYLIESLTRIAQPLEGSEGRVIEKKLLDKMISITNEIDSFLDGRIIRTLEELLSFGKMVSTLSTKRNHKLLDYDRHLYDVKQLELIPSRSISEERKLTKKNNLLLLAKDQYDLYNSALKSDLPIFHSLQSSILAPLMDLLIRFQQRFFQIQLECLENSFVLEYGDILKEYLTSVEPVMRIHQQLPLVLHLMGKGGPADPSRARREEEDSNTNYHDKKGGPSEIPLQQIPPAPQRILNSTKVCIAEYDFNSPSGGDLSFKRGDRIEIVEKNDSQDSWWKGRNMDSNSNNSKEALLFPANYVRLL